MHKINVDANIQKQNSFDAFVLIIYNQYQLPTVCDIVNSPISVEDSYLLIKNPNKKSELEVIIKVGEKVSRQQEQSIYKLIALCDLIICIELSQQLESKIQKLYLSFVPQLYARHGQTKNWIERPSLSFINESYRKTYSREAEGIHYYRTASELIASQLMMQALKTNTLSYLGNQFLQMKDQLDQPSSLTIEQFMSIYDNIHLKQKEAAQIKYSILGYKQALWTSNKKDKAEQLIFEQGADANKRLLREVDKIGLAKKDKNKLEWKYSKLNRFRGLIQEQRVNKQLVTQYKNLALYDLPPEKIVLQLKQFYRMWIRNTLKQLKLLFSNIANRRDSKALGQFRAKCCKTLEIISNCLLQCQNQSSLQLVSSMKAEIKQFIDIHESIIQDQYLSIFKYVPYQMKFLWRNEPKIYHKAGCFALILLLAWMQKNVIIGITLFSMGIIFLAINI